MNQSPMNQSADTKAGSAEKRHHRRSMVGNIYTTVDVGGEQVRAKVSDLSEGGMKIAVPRDKVFGNRDTVRIAIDEVASTLVGSVRWSSEDPNNANQQLVGVQFESLAIREIVRNEMAGEVDLPIVLPEFYDDVTRFIHVAEAIDEKVLDGKIDELGEAIEAASKWLQTTIGPVNVWNLDLTSPKVRRVSLILDGGIDVRENFAMRRKQVLQAAQAPQGRQWGNYFYCHREPIVLEFYCDLDGREQSVLAIAQVLGGRIRNWSKMIIKNISIKLIGDELDRRIMERTRELELAVNMANELSQTKTDFLSNLSHELRSPLNAVLGCSQALEKEFFGVLNPKQKEYLTDIRFAGVRLLALITDILDLSKIESGILRPDYTKVALATLLEDVVQVFRPKAEERHLRLRTELPAEFTELAVLADDRMLRQVFYNLISNALKFTPARGSVKMECEINEKEFLFHLADSGIGIEAEHKEKIFQRFYQVRDKIPNKTPGAGLGLSLCRTFVNLHGGRIEVFSEGKNRGSRFTVALPLTPPRN